MPNVSRSWNSANPVRIAGSISGVRNSDVSAPAPGRRPRESPIAAAPPIAIDSTTTTTATSNDNTKLLMNASEFQNFTNQRPEIPTGGNWMNGVGLTAKMAITAMGAIRKNRIAPFRVK